MTQLSRVALGSELVSSSSMSCFRLLLLVALKFFCVGAFLELPSSPPPSAPTLARPAGHEVLFPIVHGSTAAVNSTLASQEPLYNITHMTLNFASALNFTGIQLFGTVWDLTQASLHCQNGTVVQVASNLPAYSQTLVVQSPCMSTGVTLGFDSATLTRVRVYALDQNAPSNLCLLHTPVAHGTCDIAFSDKTTLSRPVSSLADLPTCANPRCGSFLRMILRHKPGCNNVTLPGVFSTSFANPLPAQTSVVDFSTCNVGVFASSRALTSFSTFVDMQNQPSGSALVTLRNEFYTSGPVREELALPICPLDPQNFTSANVSLAFFHPTCVCTTLEALCNCAYGQRVLLPNAGTGNFVYATRNKTWESYKVSPDEGRLGRLLLQSVQVNDGNTSLMLRSSHELNTVYFQSGASSSPALLAKVTRAETGSMFCEANSSNKSQALMPSGPVTMQTHRLCMDEQNVTVARLCIVAASCSNSSHSTETCLFQKRQVLPEESGSFSGTLTVDLDLINDISTNSLVLTSIRPLGESNMVQVALVLYTEVAAELVSVSQPDMVQPPGAVVTILLVENVANSKRYVLAVSFQGLSTETTLRIHNHTLIVNQVGEQSATLHALPLDRSTRIAISESTQVGLPVPRVAFLSSQELALFSRRVVSVSQATTRVCVHAANVQGSVVNLTSAHAEQYPLYSFSQLLNESVLTQERNECGEFAICTTHRNLDLLLNFTVAFSVNCSVSRRSTPVAKAISLQIVSPCSALAPCSTSHLPNLLSVFLFMACSKALLHTRGSL